MERKKAIVTGTALGMGRGISAVLAEEGYDIAFSYYPGTQNVEAGIETDVTMLDAAGLAVVMENGTDEAKRHADMICPSNDDDGVRIALQKLI